MTDDRKIIRQCFEIIAQGDSDLTPAVYGHFTRSLPEVSQHIDYMDERMRGRMLDQIYPLLMGESDKNYLAFEAANHQGYGADTDSYRGILLAIKATVHELLEQRWTDEEEGAWQRTIESIVGDIQRAIGLHTP